MDLYDITFILASNLTITLFRESCVAQVVLPKL